MRAAVYYNNSDVRVEEMPRPGIGPRELLMKVEASGLCGSDVMEWYRIKKAPLVLGHEVAGTIEEAGSEVTAFKAGDRVTVAHHVPCNSCRYCLAGNHSVCDTLRTTNFDPGGFAEYLRVPEINVKTGTFKLPDSVGFVEGTFSEPLGCVVRNMRASGFRPGMTVAVLGSGISGILHIKLARALGAGTIIATDVSAWRLQQAARAGADYVVRADADVPAEVRSILGRGADIVVLCAARASAVAQAIASVDRGGCLLFFAPMAPDETYPLPMFDLWRDNVRIVHSYASPPYDTEVAIDLLASKRVEVADMVTHRLPLSRSAEGFSLVAGAVPGAESLKVIIEPHAAG